MHPSMPMAGGSGGQFARSGPYHDDPAIIQRVQEDQAKFCRRTQEERREQYKCGNNYVTVADILTWPQYAEQHGQKLAKKGPDAGYRFSIDENLNGKVSIWIGDITTLEIDAVGNPANAALLGRLGSGGVDGCIHRAAGKELKRECSLLHGCETGDAKITLGYKLPAKYVIHTVGPVGENPDALESCYNRCLDLLKENNLRSIAIPCISTGKFGYPKRDAAHIALTTIRKWLETAQNADLVDRVIFCLFLKDDIGIYEDLMQSVFPLTDVQTTLKKENENSRYEKLSKATTHVSVAMDTANNTIEDID
ncbi:macro domain-containing protein mll7730-like [Glandiceps talaboti]